MLFFINEEIWSCEKNRRNKAVTSSREQSESLFKLFLTVVAVLVDLRVRVDPHGGATRHLRDPALQGGAHCQVVVLIDAFELLPDGQLLIPWQKGHLSLPYKLPPYRGQRRG